MTSSGRHQLTTPSNKVNKNFCSYYAIIAFLSSKCTTMAPLLNENPLFMYQRRSDFNAYIILGRGDRRGQTPLETGVGVWSPMRPTEIWKIFEINA